MDADMLQLTFPHNVQLNASCVTPSGKPKVTRSQKRSPIVTPQAEVPKVKKRKKIKDSLQQKMLEEDGNPTLEWFKKTYRDDDKYMSNLVKCEPVTGLDKLLSFLEKDKDSMTRFKLKSSILNPQQNNGYDCGMYVIKHTFTNTSSKHLPLLESWSKHLRYKLAASLVLSKNNDQRSRIVEIARNIPL
ncbi:hypothetical protein ACB098_01G120600 [Castanea mollissima]